MSASSAGASPDLSFPPAASYQVSVVAAVSATGRQTRPAASAGDGSRVRKPANSGRGSHSGNDRGPIQGRDLMIEKKLLVNPDEIGRHPDTFAHGREKFTPFCGYADSVIDARDPRHSRGDEPLRQVPDVDPLHEIVG